MKAIIEATGYSLKGCINILDNESYTFYNDVTMEDLAYQFMSEMPNFKNFEQYIDFTGHARDLGCYRYTEVENGVIIVD